MTPRGVGHAEVLAFLREAGPSTSQRLAFAFHCSLYHVTRTMQVLYSRREVFRREIVREESAPRKRYLYLYSLAGQDPGSERREPFEDVTEDLLLRPPSKSTPPNKQSITEDDLEWMRYWRHRARQKREARC